MGMNITPISFLQASTGKKLYPRQVLYRGCFGSCTSNYTYGENLLYIRMVQFMLILGNSQALHGCSSDWRLSFSGNMHRCHASTCFVWRVTPPEDFCGQLPLMQDSFNFLSSQPRTPKSLRSHIVSAGLLNVFSPTWTTYFQTQFCALLFHVIISDRLRIPSV